MDKAEDVVKEWGIDHSHEPDAVIISLSEFTPEGVTVYTTAMAPRDAKRFADDIAEIADWFLENDDD